MMNKSPKELPISASSKMLEFLHSRIGNTPLVDLSFLLDCHPDIRAAYPAARIFGKAEFYNPTHSIKDRLALHIICRGIQTGRLVPGKHVIVAATSGNTGAAVAQLAAALGNKCVLITTDRTSAEKVAAMRAYGATVHVVSSKFPSGHPQNYQTLGTAMAAADPEGTFDIDQYESPWNSEAYEHSLGPEIVADLPTVSHVVACASTGGTISGVARFIHQRHNSALAADDPNRVGVVLADPEGSVLAEYICHGTMGVRYRKHSHGVEGAGKDSIPGAMTPSLIDDAVRVPDSEAFDICHQVAQKTGLLIGGSSGAALAGAIRFAAKHAREAQSMQQTGRRNLELVAILPDSGTKYLSTIYCCTEDVASQAPPSPAKPLPAEKSFQDPERQLQKQQQQQQQQPREELTPESCSQDVGLSLDASHGGLIVPAQFDGVAMGIVQRLLTHLRRQQAGQLKVIDYHPPQELVQVLNHIFDLNLSAAGCDSSTLLATLPKICDAVCQHSMQTAHPRFFNLLWGGADPVAIVAEWVLAVMNTSMFTYEMSPVFTLMERSLCEALARLVYPREDRPDLVDVTFAPGGAYTNLLGCLLARQFSLPASAKTEGTHAMNVQPVIFASEHSHYTVQRAAVVMGLGSVQGCVSVRVDARGCMDPAHLRELLVEYSSRTVAGRNCVPFCVVATSGTTVLGAFDPLDEIAAVVREHNGAISAVGGSKVWLHVDASWGGAALFAPHVERLARLMRGVELADSVAVTGTKCLALPQHCAALLVHRRHRGLLRTCNSMKAACEYLFHAATATTDRNDDDRTATVASANAEEEDQQSYDLGDVNLSCGRRNDSFKFWLSWKLHGLEGMSWRSNHAWEMADVAVDEIRRHSECLRLVPQGNPPMGMNVCFWYVPRACRSAQVGDMQQQDVRLWDERVLSDATLKIREVLLRRGCSLTNHARVDGLPQFFRHITCNPQSTEEDHRELVRTIVKIGMELGL